MRSKKIIVLLFLMFLSFYSCKKSEVISQKEGSKNSPPRVLSAYFSPNNPVALSDISIIVQTVDPDGDRVNVDIKWKINDEIVDFKGETLKSGLFKKGDTISAIVKPYDGKDYGEEFEVMGITVINSLPVINRINLQPLNPVRTHKAHIDVQASDADGDNVELNFVWFVNGEVIDGANSNELDLSNFKKGDHIYVSVTPFDGMQNGPAVTSTTITIQNTPPVITSSPPKELTGGRFVYNVMGNDPDGDKIKFSLNKSPEGMTIDEESGVLIWNNPIFDKPVDVEIKVVDEDGASATQFFTITFGR